MHVEMQLGCNDHSFLACRVIITVNLSLRIGKQVKVQDSSALFLVQRLHGGVGVGGGDWWGGMWPSALHGGMKCFHAVSLCL